MRFLESQGAPVDTLITDECLDFPTHNVAVSLVLIVT